MQRMLLTLFVLSLGLTSLYAQNPGLPKVDFKAGRIQPVGQGLAVPVSNQGFATSPRTTVSVAIYDAQTRQLLATRNLSVAAIRPNQTRRAIFVPPSPRRAILVRAMVDPGNRVRESNERNNQTASRH